jgi:Zn-dependent metalloprotease
MRKLILSVACICPFWASAQIQAITLKPELKLQAERVEYNKRSNFPGFIQLNPQKSNININNEQWAAEVFPLRSQDALVFKSKYQDVNTNATYYKYQQTFNQVPVEFAMFNVKSVNGKVNVLMGDYYANMSPSNAITVDANAALEYAKKAVPAKVYKWELKREEAEIKVALNKPDFSYDPNTSLVILPININNKTEFRYAYKLDIFAHEPMQRFYVYIDAENGSVLKKISRICAADVKATGTTRYHGVQTITTDSLSPNTFILRENNRKGRGMQIETRNCQTFFENESVNFTNPTKVWNIANAAKDEAALDCHFGAERTYDYYFDSLNHDSYDGQGSKLLQYVHYDAGYFNAFWTGSYSCYGDGSMDPLTGIDVVSHEITHGVTQYTADLIYELESGALNESFSDIFGTVVEFKSLGSAASWVIGTRSFSLRDMSNPNRYNNPDTYGGVAWTNTVDCIPGGSNDGCGVHNNSGVQNFWFYVLAQGDTGVNDLKNAYAVNGIGMDKAAKIAFRNLKNYLTPQSDYADARRGSIQAAIDLYGYDSPEMISVMNAWYAVGVGGPHSVLPQAEFKFKKSVCAPGSTVEFVNTTNAAFSYAWIFGDGGTSTLENPNHVYQNVGKYTVSLIATNPNGKDTLTKTDYIIISTDAPKASTCEAITLAPKGTTGIYRVEFSNIDNASPGPNVEEPYMDYTCSRASVNRKSTYPLKITTLNTSPVFTRTYIDWNNNGAFDLPDELVLATNNTTQFHEGNVTVPDNAVLNTPLRMRIVSAKSTNNTPDVVCSGLRNGQIEDYSITVSAALGLSTENKIAFNVYPNPSNDFIYVESTEENHRLTMYDVLGREVYSLDFNKEIKIDVSEFSAGVYSLKLETGNTTQTKKLVVNK